MKKLIAILLLTLVVTGLLTACGNALNEKFKCDICGQEKTGPKHQNTVFDEQITRCEDCKNKQDQQHIALD